ncbi:MAG: gamma-glutamyltransferase family protein [Pseudomonadota bacterium]
MKGAIAAGHPLTAAAGAEILSAGGNAVDAAVGASAASWVAESPLTGPGGAGFLLVHRARERRTVVYDFFCAVPSGRAARPMDEIEVDFSGGSTQLFRIGPVSVAVPGTVAGLEAAHRAHGSLPWRELFGPAAALARDGVVLNREQAYLHEILDAILRHTPESRALFERDGGHLREGDRLRLPELGRTIELIAERGAAELRTGELARALVAHVRASGGALTESDLADFRVVRRRPVTAPFRGYEFRSNPPPSAGGVLLAYGLRLLDGTDLGEPGGPRAVMAVVEVMREQARVRDRRFARELHRGGLARRLQGEEAVEAALARLQARDQAPVEARLPGGTTHISVLDADGNAAALSVSTGSGSGVVVPGTGIQLNNMLGEFEPEATVRPGMRLTSGMSPSVALRDDRIRLVLGSAGSARLRNAVFQATVNVLGHGLGVERAIERPRLHVEGSLVHAEGGHDPAVLDALPYELARWREQNLFFGGVSAVERLDDGSLAAAGDPRRGGHGIVVE